MSWNSLHYVIKSLMVAKAGLWKRSLPGCSSCLVWSFQSASSELRSVLCSTVLLLPLPRLTRFLPTLGGARMNSIPVCFLSARSLSASVRKGAAKRGSFVSLAHTSTHCYCLNLYITFVFPAPFFSQWCFNNNRPFLGHQSGPARLFHPLLASEPWRRLFST